MCLCLVLGMFSSLKIIVMVSGIVKLVIRLVCLWLVMVFSNFLVICFICGCRCFIWCGVNVWLISECRWVWFGGLRLSMWWLSFLLIFVCGLLVCFV